MIPRQSKQATPDEVEVLYDKLMRFVGYSVIKYKDGTSEIVVKSHGSGLFKVFQDGAVVFNGDGKITHFTLGQQRLKELGESLRLNSHRRVREESAAGV